MNKKHEGKNFIIESVLFEFESTLFRSVDDITEIFCARPASEDYGFYFEFVRAEIHMDDNWIEHLAGSAMTVILAGANDEGQLLTIYLPDHRLHDLKAGFEKLKIPYKEFWDDERELF